MRKEKKVAILFDFSRGFDRGLTRGISNFINHNTNWEVFVDLPYLFRQGEPESLLDRLQKWKPDIVIMRESDVTLQLIEKGLPVVVSVVENETADWPKILTDDAAIGKLGADFFIHKGYRNIAWAGYDEYFWSQQRKQAFFKVVQDAGIKTEEYKRPDKLKGGSWTSLRDDLGKWILNLPKPLAIFATAPDMAAQLIHACKSVDINVPHDVAILSGDSDDLVCSTSKPQISFVQLETEIAGYEIGKKLEAFLVNRSIITDTIIRAETIVENASTSISAQPDKSMRLALQFIAENFREKNCNVAAIADAAGISRRNLEYKFANFLSSSVLQEVNRVRLSAVKRQLIDTSMSIKEIAYANGFSNPENFHRFFKSQTGQSPSDFRRGIG